MSTGERKRCTVWEDLRSTLDELFFRDCDLINRGTQDYRDFWLFLERHETFHSKRQKEKHTKGKDTKYWRSPKLRLPLLYDRRHKINVALLSRDVSDVTGYSITGTKKVNTSLDKKNKPQSKELSREEFLEFKSILLFYIDFCQKQKVKNYNNDNNNNSDNNNSNYYSNDSLSMSILQHS